MRTAPVVLPGPADVQRKAALVEEASELEGCWEEEVVVAVEGGFGGGGFGEEALAGGQRGLPEVDNCCVGLGSVVVEIVENFGEEMVVGDAVVPVAGEDMLLVAGVARDRLLVVVVVVVRRRLATVVGDQPPPVDVDERQIAREEPHQS